MYVTRNLAIANKLRVNKVTTVNFLGKVFHGGIFRGRKHGTSGGH